MLTGCAAPPEPVLLQCATIELPNDPQPAVLMLRDESTPDEVMKAWVATAYVYRQWNMTVRKQIKA